MSQAFVYDAIRTPQGRGGGLYSVLFIEALETVKCLDAGVITSVPDANIGSVFGIGYPAWTGGVAQYVQQYPGGPAGFAARARELARRLRSSPRSRRVLPGSRPTR